ncbi:MAG: hypothetical protein IPM99_20600 [Rubrivivax sp.]|nr:hypothetical protein [Rubrivivax sp.]
MLVDGRRLAALMIDPDVGVTARTVRPPKIDSDYFDEEVPEGGGRQSSAISIGNRTTLSSLTTDAFDDSVIVDEGNQVAPTSHRLLGRSFAEVGPVAVAQAAGGFVARLQVQAGVRRRRCMCASI